MKQLYFIEPTVYQSQLLHSVGVSFTPISNTINIGRLTEPFIFDGLDTQNKIATSVYENAVNLLIKESSIEACTIQTYTTLVHGDSDKEYQLKFTNLEDLVKQWESFFIVKTYYSIAYKTQNRAIETAICFSHSDLFFNLSIHLEDVEKFPDTSWVAGLPNSNYAKLVVNQEASSSFDNIMGLDLGILDEGLRRFDVSLMEFKNGQY